MTKRSWLRNATIVILAGPMLAVPYLPGLWTARIRMTVSFIIVGSAMLGFLISYWYWRRRSAAGRGPRK
jgi:hypothetical protein